MLNSPFTYDSIREVYDKENRKGNIVLSILPNDYQDLIKDIRDKRNRLSELRKISTKKMDDDTKAAHLSQIDILRVEIRKQSDNKETRLREILLSILEHINRRTYLYEIERDEEYFMREGKECFHSKGSVLESLLISKLLCRNLASSFKVRAANRHHIMSCIKGLLVSDKSFIVVRTDIQKFFESIPHKLILETIGRNQFVEAKVKGCIKSVLTQYDKIKTLGNPFVGVPRGVAVSSYISEIILRDFDMSVKRLPNVIFYARYVDDIFIILSHTLPGESPDDFLNWLSTSLQEMKLQIHPKGSGKTTIIDYNPKDSRSHDLEYLGYKIQFNPRKITFHLSRNRFDKIKRRIDNVFRYFDNNYKRNPHQARVDLIDCLNLLSGNTSLHKTKHGVKTGLYYSNDLLSDDCRQLCCIQNYYINAKVNRLNLDEKPFGSVVLRDAYLDRLKKALSQIDFVKRWKEKKMFSFPVHRMKELSKILGV